MADNDVVMQWRFPAETDTVINNKKNLAQAPGGTARLSADALCLLPPEHLDVLLTAWADTDRQYADQVDAARTWQALAGRQRVGWQLHPFWRTIPIDFTYNWVLERHLVRPDLRAVDGHYHERHWRQLVHLNASVPAMKRRRKSEGRLLGVLRHDVSGEWIVYAATLATSTRWVACGVIADDVTLAAQGLPAWARQRLGLPDRSLTADGTQSALFEP